MANTLQDTNSQIALREQQLSEQKQQVEQYKKAIPKTTAQQLRGMVGRTVINPLKAMLQRKTYSQARQKVSTAEQQLQQYGKDLQTYKQELANYQKTDSGKLQYAKEQGIEGEPIYGKLAKGYVNQVLGYKYSTPYGEVTDWTPKYEALKTQAKLADLESQQIQEMGYSSPKQYFNAQVENALTQSGISFERDSSGELLLKNVPNGKDSISFNTIFGKQSLQFQPTSMQERVQTQKELSPIKEIMKDEMTVTSETTPASIWSGEMLPMASAKSSNTTLNTSNNNIGNGSSSNIGDINRSSMVSNSKLGDRSSFIDRFISSAKKTFQKDQGIYNPELKGFVSASESSGQATGIFTPATQQQLYEIDRLGKVGQVVFGTNKKSENLLTANIKDLSKLYKESPETNIKTGIFFTSERPIGELSYLKDIKNNPITQTSRGLGLTIGGTLGGALRETLPNEGIYTTKSYQTRYYTPQFGTQQYDAFGNPISNVKDITIQGKKILTSSQGEKFGKTIGDISPYLIPYAGVPLFFGEQGERYAESVKATGGYKSGAIKWFSDEPLTSTLTTAGPILYGVSKASKFFREPILTRSPLSNRDIKFIGKDIGEKTIVSTRSNDIFGSKIRASKTSEGKVRLEIIPSGPIYSGIPYGNKEYYNKAVELLIDRSGYTEKEAKALLRLKKPTPKVNIFTTKSDVFKTGEKDTMSFFAAREKVELQSISPLSGKPLKPKKLTINSKIDVLDIGVNKDGIYGFNFNALDVIGTGSNMRGTDVFLKSKGTGTINYRKPKGIKPSLPEKSSDALIFSNIEKVGEVKYKYGIPKARVLKKASSDKSLSVVTTDYQKPINFKDIQFRKNIVSGELTKSESAIVGIDSSKVIDIGRTKTNLFDITNKNEKILINGDAYISPGSIGKTIGETKQAPLILASKKENILKTVLPKESTLRTSSESILLKETKSKSMFPLVSANTQTITIKETEPSVVSIKDKQLGKTTRDARLSDMRFGSVILERQENKNQQRYGNINFGINVKNNRIDNLKNKSNKTYDEKLRSGTITITTRPSKNKILITTNPRIPSPKPEEPRPRQNPPKDPFKIILPTQEQKRKKIPKSNKIGIGEEFLAITKRRGKEVILGKTKTAEEASQIARRSVLSTLGATAKVITTKGRQIKLREDKIFRASKQNPLSIVQRRSARLSSIGERREIKSSRRNTKPFQIL